MSRNMDKKIPEHLENLSTMCYLNKKKGKAIGAAYPVICVALPLPMQRQAVTICGSGGYFFLPLNI